jgi:hypothetical protein
MCSQALSCKQSSKPYHVQRKARETIIGWRGVVDYLAGVFVVVGSGKLR